MSRNAMAIAACLLAAVFLGSLGVVYNISSIRKTFAETPSSHQIVETSGMDYEQFQDWLSGMNKLSLAQMQKTQGVLAKITQGSLLMLNAAVAPTP